MGLISGSNQSAFCHGRLEVVQDQAPGHPAEVPEGALQAAEEVVGGLAVDGLAVALAGVAQDDAEDVGLAPLAVGADDRGAGAEVDLGLVAGVALDAAEGQVVRPLEPADEPADAVVAADEAVVGDQVLVDPLGGEPEVALGPDQSRHGSQPLARPLPRGCGTVPEPVGAMAGSARRRRPRSRWAHWLVLAVVGAVRAGGRIGWFWRSVRLSEVTGDGLAVDPQFVGDAALGPAPAVQCTDGFADGHLEQIRHGRAPGARDLPRSLTGESGSPQNGWFSSAPRWLVLSAR